VLSPELRQTIVAQGAMKVENPSTAISYYGYDNNVLNTAGQPVMVPTSTNPTEPARNKLGMSVQDVTPQLRQMYGLSDDVRGGVVVTSVKAVSAAADANIGEGDVITEVQGQRVGNSTDFRSAIDHLHSGSKVRMYVTTATRGAGSPLSSYRYVTIP